jgi:hypothetical protein
MSGGEPRAQSAVLDKLTKVVGRQHRSSTGVDLLHQNVVHLLSTTLVYRSSALGSGMLLLWRFPVALLALQGFEDGAW